ncbi:MAG: MscL family protein [Flavobacterium sp.]
MVWNDSINELKKFVIENNIVGTSAGVCVALAAKDGIQSLVGDIIMPSIVALLHALRIEGVTKFLPVEGHMKFNIANFIKEMVTFILIIVLSFLFVKVAFEYLLGIDREKKDSNTTKESLQMRPATYPLSY